MVNSTQSLKEHCGITWSNNKSTEKKKKKSNSKSSCAIHKHLTRKSAQWVKEIRIKKREAAGPQPLMPQYVSAPHQAQEHFVQKFKEKYMVSVQHSTQVLLMMPLSDSFRRRMCVIYLHNEGSIILPTLSVGTLCANPASVPTLVRSLTRGHET